MHAAVMYQCSFLVACGGFDKSLRVCEDYELYLRLARLHPVRCHDRVIAEYRTHPASASADTGKMLHTALAVLRSQRRHFQGDPRRSDAYRAGRRYWKGFYAQQLVNQLSTRRGRGGLGKSLRDAIVIGWYAPAQLSANAYQRWVRPVLPTSLLRAAARARGQSYYPSVGRIRFGDLRRLTPISEWFGYDRGLPIDRHYIERFLTAHATDVRGRVLEIGDADYTRRFGGRRVTRNDVLHVAEGNPQATMIGDLTDAGHVPSETFDCAIVTQTLHLIYDVHSALGTLHRILKPGGVLLITTPGISQVSNDQWGESWYWSFSTLSMRRLLEEFFPAEGVEVEAFGNVLAAMAFMQGIATDELATFELEYRDHQFEFLITGRAVKLDPPTVSLG
jgi:SAM-dependent methyltransferase